MSRSYSEPNLQKQLQDIGDAVRNLQNAQRSANLPISTALPQNPYDGQVVLFKGSLDTATKPGVVWTLRYNKNSPYAYKWDFIGGAAGYVQQTSQSGTFGAGWNNAPTNQNDFTVQLGGDYEIGGYSIVQLTTAQILTVSPVQGAAGTNSGFFAPGFTVPASGWVTAPLTGVMEGVAANTLIRTRYYAPSGGAFTIGGSVLTVKPVRVG